MSGLIFPSIAGRMLTKYRRPTANTRTQRTVSGKESRIALRAFPILEWELSFDWLPDNSPPGGLGRYNLVPYSQDFTQWTAAHAGAGLAPVVVGSYVGQTAPDGTYTADRVILNALPGSTGSDTSSVGIVADAAPPLFPPIGQQCCISLWMATADGSTVQVAIAGLSGSQVVTVTGAWQRFSAVQVRSSASVNLAQVLVSAGGATSKYADLLLWGAQAEYGSAATRYIPTNGSPLRQSDFAALNGFFTQMLGQWDTFLYPDPDFNSVQLAPFATGNGTTAAFNLTAAFQPLDDISQYGGIGGLGGQPEWIQNTNGAPAIYTARYGFPELLSTGSRTNLAKQSNFAGTWTSTNLTLTTGATTAPDGTTTAASLNAGTATGTHFESQGSIAITASGRYTFSVWLKASTQQFVALNLDNGSTDGVTATFDLVNGVASTALINGTAYVSNADVAMVAGPNGWYRCSISGQLAAADTTARTSITFVQSAAAAWYPSYTGTSLIAYAWGAQFEAGTVPTALIPTTTTSLTNGGSDYSLTNLTQAGTAVWTFQQVQLVAAPGNNVPLLWTGSFFYRVRFSEDAIEPVEFLFGHWKLESLKLEQVLL